MALSSILPAPVHKVYDKDEDKGKRIQIPSQALMLASATIPPYGHRKGWVPRNQDDFGDGGAFPEIPIAQFPLGMGQTATQRPNALPMMLDASGQIKYDVLVKANSQGATNDTRVIYSKLSDLQPKPIDDEDPAFSRPSEEEMQDTTERTREALEGLVRQRTSAARGSTHVDGSGGPEFVRYTPAQQGMAFAGGSKQRIIRMVEVQRDPLSPPRFSITKKIPKGPPSPPPPVMHSPPRKLSAKEQTDWRIPPCISNWKNPKGHTIPLDKRLAADGRGLQTTHLNEKFAQLSEALYIADRKAREAVEMRAQIEEKLAQRQKEKKEEELRFIAQKAREERAGIRRTGGDEQKEAASRDQIRHELEANRARERNMARAAGNTKGKRERDITEEIALNPSRKPTSTADSQFDSRLFNQSKGIDSGFRAGDDEAYNIYDAPWRSEKDLGKSIYRPSKAIDQDNYGDDAEKIAQSRRFVADKEFSGTDHGRRLTGPVAFERGSAIGASSGAPAGAAGGSRGGGGGRPGAAPAEDEPDPFGLNEFLAQAKLAGNSAPSGSGSKSTGASKRPAPASSTFESSRDKRDRR